MLSAVSYRTRGGFCVYPFPFRFDAPDVFVVCVSLFVGSRLFVYCIHCTQLNCAWKVVERSEMYATNDEPSRHNAGPFSLFERADRSFEIARLHVVIFRRA